jgi:sporulation protein YlmC with PRC-barrel domain
MEDLMNEPQEETPMKKLASVAVLIVSLAAGTIPAFSAQEGTEMLKTVPSDSYTVSEFYQQDVYDEQDKKIGAIDDVLLDKNGQLTAVILGVGGLLGVGATDVAVPFKALHMKEKDGKRYLVLNTTKETLESNRARQAGLRAYGRLKIPTASPSRSRCPPMVRLRLIVLARE